MLIMQNLHKNMTWKLRTGLCMTSFYSFVLLVLLDMVRTGFRIQGLVAEVLHFPKQVVFYTSK